VVGLAIVIVIGGHRGFPSYDRPRADRGLQATKAVGGTGLHQQRRDEVPKRQRRTAGGRLLSTPMPISLRLEADSQPEPGVLSAIGKHALLAAELGANHKALSYGCSLQPCCSS